MTKQTPKWSPDTWAAIIATVAALIALYVAIDQGRQAREHNRLSVAPMLSLERLFRVDEDQGLFLGNKGLGPAIIREMKIYVDGKEVQNEEEAEQQLMKLVPEYGSQFNLKVTKFHAQSVVEVGERVPLLVVPLKYTNEQTEQTLRKVLDHLGQVIAYESAYGDVKFTGRGRLPDSERNRVERYGLAHP